MKVMSNEIELKQKLISLLERNYNAFTIEIDSI